MDNRRKIDIREIRVDDWVLIDGVARQVRSLASKVITDDGEFFLNRIEGIKLTDEDIEIALEKVMKYDRSFQISVRETQYSKYYVDILRQEKGRDMIAISKPVVYYHELQHTLREGGCVLGLNYKWKEYGKEDKEDGNRFKN